MKKIHKFKLQIKKTPKTITSTQSVLEKRYCTEKTYPFISWIESWLTELKYFPKFYKRFEKKSHWMFTAKYSQTLTLANSVL